MNDLTFQDLGQSNLRKYDECKDHHPVQIIL